MSRGRKIRLIMWRSMIGCRVFGTTKSYWAMLGPCVQPVSRHSTAQSIGQAVPAQLTSAQTRPCLGHAGRGGPFGHLYVERKEKRA